MCHDAAMWKRLGRWIAANPSDPVPRVLTIAGCVLSTFALGYGVFMDWRGFALNVAAALVLLGPALVISNVLVKTIQEARLRRRIAPLAITTTQTLHWAAGTAKQAFDMLGVGATVDLATKDNQPFSTMDRVESALADAYAALKSICDDQERFPREINLVRPLEFPPLGAIRRLVEQIDRSCPVPLTVTLAHIAEDWGERRGVNFYYAEPDGDTVEVRYIGLDHIAEFSRATNSTTKVHRRDYLACAEGSVRQAKAIVTSLKKEIPPGLKSLASMSVAAQEAAINANEQLAS
jgi:hypothetical protein